MRFFSTRSGAGPLTLSDAILQGLASDGGLFVPDRMPVLPLTDFPAGAGLASIAGRLLAPLAEGDRPAGERGGGCAEGFDFPAPVRPLARARGRPGVLELFHGPTCAFKDFGARFTAAALARVHRSRGQKVTILVATSGDTGAAVAAAFHVRSGASLVLSLPQ